MPPGFWQRGIYDLWHPDMLVVLTLIAATYLYFTGPGRRYFKQSEPVPWIQRAAFVAGVYWIWLAVGSPLDPLSDNYLFSAHMMEHMILTLVSPPLLLAGTPAWLLRPALRVKIFKKILTFLTRPVIALILFNALFSAYHAPIFYEAGLHNENVHFAEHAVIFVFAIFMWWPVLSPLPEMPRLPDLIQMIYLFIDGLMMTPVFALVTFSGTVLYPTYLHAPRVFGITPLHDQQFGGIIMKLVAMVSYGSMFCMAFFRWAGKERRKEDEAQAALRAHVVQLPFMRAINPDSGRMSEAATVVPLRRASGSEHGDKQKGDDSNPDV